MHTFIEQYNRTLLKKGNTEEAAIKSIKFSLYVFFVSVGGVYFVVASFFFRSVSTVLSHDNTTLNDEIPSAVGNLTSPVTVKTPSVYDFVVNLKPASLLSG